MSHVFRMLVGYLALVALGVAGAALAAAGGSTTPAVTVSIDDHVIHAPVKVAPGEVSFVVVNAGKARHRLAISSEAGVAGVSAVAAGHGARVRFTVYLAPDVYTLADPSAARVRQRRLDVAAPVTQPTTTNATCDDTTPQCIGWVVEDG